MEIANSKFVTDVQVFESDNIELFQYILSQFYGTMARKQGSGVVAMWSSEDGVFARCIFGTREDAVEFLNWRRERCSL